MPEQQPKRNWNESKPNALNAGEHCPSPDYSENDNWSHRNCILSADQVIAIRLSAIA